MSKPVIAAGWTLVSEPPPCVGATVHQPDDNPFLPVAAADDRGTLHGLDFASVRPHLVEVIHSGPGAVRGNHVHRYAAETFTVLVGDLSMFLACGCSGRHLLEVSMAPGTTVQIAPGIPHAVFARTRNESIAVFGHGDPRNDRDRVMLLEF